LRRHVAVHDDEALSARVADGVHRVKASRRIGDDARGEHGRETAAAGGALGHGGEGLPVQVLHREKARALGLAKVKHLAHVRIDHERGEPRLTAKHLLKLRRTRHLVVDELERHRLAEAPVAAQLGQVHLAHAARREVLAQHITSESTRLRRRIVSRILPVARWSACAHSPKSTPACPRRYSRRCETLPDG
jgi:hypothetical protein